MEKQMAELMDELLKTFTKKNADYGDDNIARFGEIGVLIRMNDKMSRLNNLIIGGKTANNEAIEDTLKDLAVYALIDVLIRSGKWKNAKNYKLTEA